MTRLSIAFSLTVLVGGLGAVSSRGAETRATLSLTGLSFVAFQENGALFFPGGGRLTFRFGTPEPDGRVPFTLAPADVALPEIDTGEGGQLRYELAEPADGVLRRTDAGLVLEFPATVRVTRRTADWSGSYLYSLVFTTERAEASNLAGTKAVAVDGARLDAKLARAGAGGCDHEQGGRRARGRSRGVHRPGGHLSIRCRISRERVLTGSRPPRRRALTVKFRIDQNGRPFPSSDFQGEGEALDWLFSAWGA